MRVDADHDGTFETLVSPTSAVDGAAAADSEPPAIALSTAVLSTGRVFSLTAQDNGSGVARARYSTDGTVFRPYDSPLALNPYRTPALYAPLADDRAANRSGIVQFKLLDFVPHDTLAPTTNTTVTPGTTSTTNVSVLFSAVDGGEAGVEKIVYTVTGAQSERC